MSSRDEEGTQDEDKVVLIGGESARFRGILGVGQANDRFGGFGSFNDAHDARNVSSQLIIVDKAEATLTASHQELLSIQDLERERILGQDKYATVVAATSRTNKVTNKGDNKSQESEKSKYVDQTNKTQQSNRTITKTALHVGNSIQHP